MFSWAFFFKWTDCLRFLTPYAHAQKTTGKKSKQRCWPCAFLPVVCCIQDGKDVLVCQICFVMAYIATIQWITHQGKDNERKKSYQQMPRFALSNKWWRSRTVSLYHTRTKTDHGQSDRERQTDKYILVTLKCTWNIDLLLSLSWGKIKSKRTVIKYCLLERLPVT